MSQSLPLSRMAGDSRRLDSFAAFILLGSLLLQLAVLPPSAHAQMGVGTTTVSCSPSCVVVGSSTSCTATVGGMMTTPTGTVTFLSRGAGTFYPSSTCTLALGTCTVSYAQSSSTPSTVTITAVYEGDANNDGSIGMFYLVVAFTNATSAPSTTTTFSTSLQSSRASNGVIPLVVTAAVVVALLAAAAATLDARRSRANPKA